MPLLVSKEQKAFIQGRCIKYYTCLASKSINHLDNKSFGGNLALKVDDNTLPLDDFGQRNW